MTENLFVNPLIIEIVRKYKPLWALAHMQALAGWDSETYMPISGAPARGEAQAQVSVLVQNMLLEEDFVSLVYKASESQDSLNDYEIAVVRELKRSVERLRKLPAYFVEEYEKVTNEAVVVWRTAKKENSFKQFAPHLDRIIALTKEQADYIGYKDHPYDALIDQYEEGWSSADLDQYFTQLEAPLAEILEAVLASNAASSNGRELESLPYSQEQMAKLNESILGYFSVSKDSLRLDISAHPFTQKIALHDVRITTWYHSKDWARSMMGTIHEYGHALYEMQVDPRLEFSPIQSPISLGVHESQSRFWENMIGRSESFLKVFLPDIKNLSPEIGTYIDKEGLGGVVRYINKVRPGVLRTEADEITYHFHVKLRYEIEKGLLDGSFSVNDLPDIWNAKMKKYLGIIPEDMEHGVLQDIHWSMGAFGYFPTYSIGTTLSAMWRQGLEQELGALEGLVGTKVGIVKIQSWLREYVHSFGGTYTLKELVQSKLHKGFGVDDLLGYLWKKYLPETHK